MNETYTIGSVLWGIGLWFSLIYGCYWILSRHHDFKANWLAVIAIIFPMNVMVASVFLTAGIIRIIYELLVRKGATDGRQIVY